VAEAWANSIDLHLDVAGTRVRNGLESALREAIRTGRLHAGTRLPPSRALAADLGVARNTVAEAYGQLVAEGWLAARTGAGTWVTRDPLPARQPPVTPVPETAPPRYDLRPGVPDLSAFPRREWLAAARAALGAAPDHVMGYPDPRGLPQLRTALAAYLARTRGVSAAPGRIVVCSGFGHGLALLCRLLRARGGDTIAVEGYGHRSHRRLAESHGLRASPVRVDGGGAVPAELGTAAAALLTPAHQFPLGVTLRPQRRRDVVTWASDTGGLVIEDDYDGEFRYDRQPVGAMQSLAPEHVVHAGTASKSLAPGLRLGWLVLPDRLVDEVVAVMEAFPSSLDQLTLAAFLTSGGYDRQVRHARLSYRRRRDRLLATLHRRAPKVRVTGIAAGLHALLELPGDRTEDDLIARAAGHGLAIDGLASYTAPGQRHAPALVIGYARPPDHAFTTALARLCTVLK
jgi:GntR family transcriptional regulator/MocR family aminotransferase